MISKVQPVIEFGRFFVSSSPTKTWREDAAPTYYHKARGGAKLQCEDGSAVVRTVELFLAAGAPRTADFGVVAEWAYAPSDTVPGRYAKCVRSADGTFASGNGEPVTDEPGLSRERALAGVPLEAVLRKGVTFRVTGAEIEAVVKADGTPKTDRDGNPVWEIRRAAKIEVVQRAFAEVDHGSTAPIGGVSRQAARHARTAQAAASVHDAAADAADLAAMV